MKDQSILITGASSGFGAQIAKRFAADKRPLILLARRKEKLEVLAAELSEFGSEVTLLVEDIQNTESVVQAIKPHAADISLLVNNAGLALGLDLAQNASLKDWQTMINTNIQGALTVTNTVLPAMVKKNRGLIVNIGSIAGTYPYPGGNIYGATKAFLKQFSLNLKADLLGTKVRVSNIEPGAAETEFSNVRYRGDLEKASSIYQGWESFTADDIAEAVHWIDSLPERVNINSLEIMATQQSFGPFCYAKE